jgi:alkyl hydroperoxide reductase subunit AhpC
MHQTIFVGYFSHCLVCLIYEFLLGLNDVAVMCGIKRRSFTIFSYMAKVQKPAPQFTATAVINGEFKQVSLSDYAGKYVVLFFYPLDWTFVCPTEIIAFSEKAAEFKKLNCEVLGISVDSEFSHYHWINTPRKMGGLGGLEIPLVADISKEICKNYGVLIDEGVALRGTFIIDDKQIVRVAQINDLPVGRNVDEVYRLVEAIQFHEANGQVCPANWQKGAATMKPDPRGSLEYFSKIEE